MVETGHAIRSVQYYLRWTSASDGRLSRKRLSVRLGRCAGVTARDDGEAKAKDGWWRRLKLKRLLLLLSGRGGDSVELLAKESSESDRLRLRSPIVVDGGSQGR